MEKISRETPDLTQENIAKIAALFPDVVTETKDADGNVILAVDFDALRDDLSGEVVDGPRERYQFTWPGKREAKLEAAAPSKGPCVHAPRSPRIGIRPRTSTSRAITSRHSRSCVRPTPAR